MKKLLAILLALTLALTLVPTLAFAQNEDGAESGIVEESKETPTEAPEGETTEEPKEEPQENPEDKTKEEPKEDGKEETKEDSEDKLEDTGDVQAAPLLAAENTDAGTPVVLDVNTHVIDKVLQPGNYVLNSGIALSTMDLKIRDNVTIDLNGCSMQLRSLTISSTGSLTLKNSQKGSGGIGNVPPPRGTNGLFLTVYGTFIMDDGVCISDVSVIFYVISMGRAGKLIMNEGSSIKNCKADSGVVEVEGTFIMNGGTITGNTKHDNTPTTAVNGYGRFYQYGGAIDGTVQGAAIEWDATENAYLIYTAEGLKAFRDMVNKNSNENSVYAKLKADIVLNDGTFDENGNYTKGASGKAAEQWEPISGFAISTFDGGGHTISGLYVTGVESAGLFEAIYWDDIVKNVAVTGYVKGTTYAGGIVGAARGGSIEGCVNLCRVSVVGESSGPVYAGGIVGELGRLEGGSSPGSIQNCANWGEISASTPSGYSTCVGGIAGAVVPGRGSTIANCYSVGKVSGGEKSKNTIHGICCDNRTNSYYLTGTVVNDPTLTDSSRREKAEFANGTVLARLKGNDTNSPWTKTGYLAAAGMALPLLSWQTADEHTCNTDGVLGGCTCGLLPEGKGTENAPYDIKTAEDLKAFRDLVNGGKTDICGKLMNDITLNDGKFDNRGNWSEDGTPEQWTPIGWYNSSVDHLAYTGTFDGNGHTIKGLYVKDKDKAGLFGELHGTIKNLAVTGYVQGGMFVGGIAATANGGRIENCVNLCCVVANGNNGSKRAYAGGIVGQDTGGAILNCANLGAIICNVGAWILIDYAAGIAGWVDNTTITRCYNVGGISENGIGEHGSRGIAGAVYSVNVSHCYWLAGSVKDVDDTADDAKTKVEFANELLSLLQNGDENSPWTKTGYLAAAKMTLPLLKWQTADDHTHDGAQWLSDATSHWKECSCGVIYDKAAHSGGTATCKDQAKCSICGQPYGQLASGGIRRQPTGGSGAANTSDTTKTVKSGNTGDAGIALYAGMALLSLTGGAWLRRKKH